MSRYLAANQRGTADHRCSEPPHRAAPPPVRRSPHGGGMAAPWEHDDRSASADIWSTVLSFHPGDDATVWGLTPQDFNIAWSNNEGASGFTGLTLHATAAGKPTASLTLAGFTTDDMSNGRISVTFGHDAASGSSFMNVHSNS